MRRLRSIWGIRWITASLLFSVLSLVISPCTSFTGDDSVDRYADWLRKQLGGRTTDAVERAIATAVAADTHNLTHFLEAFLDAYSRATLPGDEAMLSDAALVALLNSRYLQLVGKPIAPLLILKSLSVRSSISSERTASHLFALVKKKTAEHAESERFFFAMLSGGRFVQAIASAIKPRGP